MENRKHIYFLSDVHLGSSLHKSTHDTEQKLCRWLDSVYADAAAIYLLGDIFDYWFEYKDVVPRGFVRLLGKLAEMTDAGIKIHFFIGNHDIWVTDYLSKECGLIIHKEPYITEFNGAKFYLAHGDGLGDESKSFQFLRKVFHSNFLRKAYASLHPRWTVPLAHSWSNKSRKTGGDMEYLGEDKEPLVIFAKKLHKQQPDINYFIFGHRHIMLDLMIASTARVSILGDWLQYFSYGVFDGENFELQIFE